MSNYCKGYSEICYNYASLNGCPESCMPLSTNRYLTPPELEVNNTTLSMASGDRRKVSPCMKIVF